MSRWYGRSWVDGPLFINPQAGDVLVQYAPTPAGAVFVRAYVYASTGMEAVLQRLNRSGTVQQALILPVVLAEVYDTRLPMRLDCDEGETLRIIARASVVGEVQASLFLGA